MKGPYPLHRHAIDIGSTVIKLATVGVDGRIVKQRFFPRNFEAGISVQVREILAQALGCGDETPLLAASSANGGLRVGVLCASEHFSGTALRNQVLLAGANPVYVLEMGEDAVAPYPVDILLVGGGIDDPDCGPLERRLEALDLHGFRYGMLMYAGNRYLADRILAIEGDAHVVNNPLASALRSEDNGVFHAIRDAYLDDLVHKDGLTDLPERVAHGIRPTPEVVNRGFQRVISNRSSLVVPGATVVVDIGGATTDLHYTVEIVRVDSFERPNPGTSVARYVFADLGIVASRDSTLMQMRSHPRIYEFLSAVLDGGVREVYGALREGELDPEPLLLAYGCLFLAFDRFGNGRGPGLPSVNLSRISCVILTGGAAQSLDPSTTERLFALFNGRETVNPKVIVDRDYQLWVDGITWGMDQQAVGDVAGVR